MERGLGLVERKEGNFASYDGGNFIHAVMQEMGAYLVEKCQDLQDGGEAKFDQSFEKEYLEKAKAVANDLVNKNPYKTLLDTESGSFTASCLTDGAITVSMELYKHINNSSFKIEGVESEKYLILDDGITIKCKIDRIDSCGAMVRLSGYKT